jgi:hypothetical protein
MTEHKGPIGRKNRKNNFTQISNTLLEDSRLSWRAKGLLCYMLSRPDNWKINRTDLYRRATEGRDAMQNALNELKEFNYLHVYQNQTENGKFEGWVWEYGDEPFTPEVLKNQTTEKPQEMMEIRANPRLSENPSFGNSVLRDSSHYNNTDFNNTDYNNTKSKEPKRNTSNPEIEREFERLWKLYPRKLGKKKAFDSFKKARKVKKIPYEIIENGLYRYITYLEQQETEESFIMHGSTWFNQEKWQDEYITTGMNKKPKNAMEYLRAKYNQGEDYFEPSRNGEVIDYYSEVIPEPFQGFRP